MPQEEKGRMDRGFVGVCYQHIYIYMHIITLYVNVMSLGWRRLLLGWRPSLLGWPLPVGTNI